MMTGLSLNGDSPKVEFLQQIAVILSLLNSPALPYGHEAFEVVTIRKPMWAKWLLEQCKAINWSL